MKDIIFDLGGVLIDWNPRYLYKKIFASAEEMEWFLTSVCSPVWNAKQDAGRPFAEGIAQAKAQYPKYAPQIDDYFLRWEEMLGGPIKGTVQLLRELKYKNYRIFALSNWSAETFPIAQKKFDFLGLFDGIVLSGEEKMNKPEPEIYKRLLCCRRITVYLRTITKIMFPPPRLWELMLFFLLIRNNCTLNLLNGEFYKNAPGKPGR